MRRRAVLWLYSGAGILLVAGCLILANLISARFRLRADFSADGLYSLSRGSKRILKDLPDPVEISLEQGLVEAHGCLPLGACPGDAHVDVATNDVLGHAGAHGVLEGFELGREMETDVQAAVVQTLQAHDQLAGGRLAAHLGVSGHAAYRLLLRAHGFTRGSSSRNWSWWSR